MDKKLFAGYESPEMEVNDVEVEGGYNLSDPIRDPEQGW